jgi:hypothetical protein
MEETVDQNEKDEMAEMVEEVLSRVVLKALEGEDQDVSEKVHPVLDLDEEIRMLRLRRKLSFFPASLRRKVLVSVRPKDALGTEYLL